MELRTALIPQPIWIRADALQIQQVLVNLIQNAIQTMAQCEAGQRRLRISTFFAMSEVCLQVADTGPGFSVDDIESVFKPFCSTKPDGLGMGLAISRSIIEQYQGRIWGENQPSGGAAVTFSMPPWKPHEADRGQEIHCVCG